MCVPELCAKHTHNKIVFFPTDCTGSQNRYCMVQYYFKGPEVAVQIKPHGNSKSSLPFFRTSASAKTFHRKLASESMPKEVVHQATQLQGVELEARGLGSLPRNRAWYPKYRPYLQPWSVLRNSHYIPTSDVGRCYNQQASFCPRSNSGASAGQLLSISLLCQKLDWAE